MHSTYFNPFYNSLCGFKLIRRLCCQQTKHRSSKVVHSLARMRMDCVIGPSRFFRVGQAIVRAGVFGGWVLPAALSAARLPTSVRRRQWFHNGGVFADSIIYFIVHKLSGSAKERLQGEPGNVHYASYPAFLSLPGTIETLYLRQ